MTSQSQVVRCWTQNSGQTGQYVDILGKIPKLYKMYSNDAFCYCCFNGIWFMYDENDYNLNNQNAASYLGNTVHVRTYPVIITQQGFIRVFS